MRNATDVKTAQARASIARQLMLGRKELGRSFDDCFECGDGDEVHRLLILMASKDDELVKAMRRHKDDDWADQAIALRDAPPVEIQPDLFGGEPTRIHRKAIFEDGSKGRQLDLIPGMKDAPGQVVMFEEPGMPDELVWKKPPE